MSPSPKCNHLGKFISSASSSSLFRWKSPDRAGAAPKKIKSELIIHGAKLCGNNGQAEHDRSPGTHSGEKCSTTAGPRGGRGKIFLRSMKIHKIHDSIDLLESWEAKLKRRKKVLTEGKCLSGWCWKDMSAEEIKRDNMRNGIPIWLNLDNTGGGGEMCMCCCCSCWKLGGGVFWFGGEQAAYHHQLTEPPTWRDSSLALIAPVKLSEQIFIMQYWAGKSFLGEESFHRMCRAVYRVRFKLDFLNFVNWNLKILVAYPLIFIKYFYPEFHHLANKI